MREVLQVVAAAGLAAAASEGAGLVLLRCAGFQARRGETLFLGFVSGSALLSAAVFGATACGLASAAVFAGLGVAMAMGLVWGWRWVMGLERGAGLSRWFWLVYAVFAGLYVVNALAPETGPDALAYHVADAARTLEAGRFAAGEATLLAGMPQGVDMLFLFAYALGGRSAPAMVHCLFLLALPLGMAAYGGRAGAVGGLLVFLSPIAGRAGTSAYVDVALAAVGFAVFQCVEMWRERESRGLAVVAGVVAGFAFSIKYTAFVAVAFVLGWMMWRRRWRAAVVAFAAAVAVAAPCLVKNAVLLGNPVFPFANRLFPNAVIQPVFEEELGRMMRRFNGVEWREVPLEATVRGLRLNGLAGAVFLFAPLGLLALREARGRRVLLAAAVFGAPYVSNTGTRFLLPALPFVGLAMAMGVERWRGAGAAMVAFHAVWSWPASLALTAQEGAWRLEGAPVEAALRVKPEEEYLREARGDYELSRMINARVGAGERILSLSGISQLDVRAGVIMAGQSTVANAYRDILLAGVLEELRPVRVSEAEFGVVRAEAVRVRARMGDEAPWSVAELRVGRAGGEVARGRGWRVRSSSNIWAAAWAVDNNPVTRWTAGERGSWAQSLELEFGGAESVDRVWMETARGPAAVRVEARVGGVWREVASAMKERRGELPARMRRASVETLKREGIGWLVAHERDAGARDFARRTAQWGMRLECESNRYRLYRFE